MEQAQSTGQAQAGEVMPHRFATAHDTRVFAAGHHPGQ
jgi:hypothetical protein